MSSDRLLGNQNQISFLSLSRSASHDSPRWTGSFPCLLSRWLFCPGKVFYCLCLLRQMRWHFLKTLGWGNGKRRTISLWHVHFLYLAFSYTNMEPDTVTALQYKRKKNDITIHSVLNWNPAAHLFEGYIQCNLASCSWDIVNIILATIIDNLLLFLML